MVSLAELRDLKLTELTEASDGWADVSGRAHAARGRVDDEMKAKLTASQEGVAATAAVADLARLSRNFQYIHTECGMIRASLSGLAQELAVPQRRLTEALADAEALGFTVHADGSVRYPPAPPAGPGAAGVPGLGRPGSPAEAPAAGGQVSGANGLLGRMLSGPVSALDPNPNAAKAQDVADRIAAALTEAGRVDAEYAAALTRLRAPEGLDVTAAMWGDVAGDAAAFHRAADDVFKDAIPTGASPAARKAWWDGLSEEDRVAYLAAYPDTLGNLDGIPALTRDEANRSYLPVLMGKLEAQGDEAAETKLAGLRSIDAQLRAGSQPPMFLLGVGDQGLGRAIVSYGNPDTARNVSAYVPGLGTGLDESFARNDLKRAFDTARGAQKLDPASASIVWLGYDPPQSIDVMSTGDARRGAPAYNSFMDGLGATNENADPHLTAIGHSYGSLTVGQASQQPGGIPGADDIILVGSPGVGVDRAEDMGVAKNHVWVGAADNDIVAKLPSEKEVKAGAAGAFVGGLTLGPLAPLGMIAGGMAGADLADLNDDDLYFGKDPASETFGANRFRTEPGPELFGDGIVPDVEAHSNYFNPEKDQMSSESIAAIVAGQPGKVTPEARR